MLYKIRASYFLFQLETENVKKFDITNDIRKLSTEKNTSLAGLEKDDLEIPSNHQDTKTLYTTDDICKLSTEENASVAGLKKISGLVNDSSVNTATITELAKAQEKQILLSFNKSASIKNLNEFNKATEAENVKKFDSIEKG